MPNPLVSVIVPVYRVENYLHRAVDSLINQTYTNLEIILVDDGSPDRCPQICDEYAGQDSRIKVIHKPNGGLSDARNTGLAIASGDYLVFLDSDDYLHIKAIEILISEAIRHKACIVCCGMNIVDSDNNIYDHRKCDENFVSNNIDATKLLLQDRFPHNFACGKLYKRELFDNLQFPVGRLYEDTATTYLAVNRAKSVLCLKDCLYYYERGREGNITSELSSAKAAKSYYHGCLNSLDRIRFCKNNSNYLDMMPTVYRQLFSWSKLCLESAIKSGKKEYLNYFTEVKAILDKAAVRLPIRLWAIISFPIFYFYIYPIIGRNR